MSPRRTQNAYKIGITGSICSGKSRAVKMLRKMGFSTLDTQEVLYQMAVSHPAINRQLVGHFGKKIQDRLGNISRKKLEDLTTTNVYDKKFLLDILNPLVREEVKHFLYGPLGTFIRFVESPLLFETDTQHLYNEVWVVWVDPEVHIQRLVRQDKLTEAEARVRLASEWPQEEKRDLSQRLIDNSGDWTKTEIQIKEALSDVKNKGLQAF